MIRFLHKAMTAVRSHAARNVAELATADPFSLDTELWRWSDSDADAYCVRQAVEGTAVLLQNGGGKTSAIGRHMATAYMAKGQFGITVLCVKSDEIRWWQEMAADAGRSEDLIIFGHPDYSPWRFNILQYEAERAGVGAGQAENITSLIINTGKVLQRGQSGQGGRDNDQFWESGEKSLVRNAVDLCLLSGTPLSVDMLRQIVLSAPTSLEQARSNEWRERSPCWRLLAEAAKRCTSGRAEHDLGVTADYFLRIFADTHERTRSIFTASFSATTELLSRGILRELFCTETNIRPDVLADGKIVILALPIKEFGDVGLLGATLWRQAVMRWVERRDVRMSPRPVCVWMDEASHLVTSGDMLFASSCRSVRCALVMMGHNVGAFHIALGGGEKGKAETDGLFGVLCTKIVGANSDVDSCTWAANLIGKAPKLYLNASHSNQPQDWLGAMTGLGHSPSTNAGVSEQMDYVVSPWEFSTLRTGSARNAYCVDTVVIQSGRTFSDGRTWRPFTFHQKH